MLAIPRRIKGVTHPLIDDMYMKKEVKAENDIKNILVIMTQKNASNKNGLGMMELLGDLKNMQSKIENTAGRFDRVDIKSA